MLGRIGEAKSDGGGFANGENTCTHVNDVMKQRQGFKPRFPYEPKRYGMESLSGYMSGDLLITCGSIPRSLIWGFTTSGGSGGFT